MNVQAIEKFGPLAAARKSSLITQEQMAERIGCSVPTIISMEKNPNDVSLATLGAIYHTVGNDGKAIIEKFINDFFIG